MYYIDFIDKGVVLIVSEWINARVGYVGNIVATNTDLKIGSTYELSPCCIKVGPEIGEAVKKYKQAKKEHFAIMLRNRLIKD